MTKGEEKMSDTHEERVVEVAEALEVLAGEMGSRVGERRGGELSLMAGELRALSRRPPTLRTADFVNQGDEVPFTSGFSGVDGIVERIIDGNDFLPVHFLEQGLRAQRSVGRVVLRQAHAGFPVGTGWATGFLIGPSLFLTNNHVIGDEDFAAKIRFQFNFQLRLDGTLAATESYLPDLRIFHTNADLDYTIVGVQPRQELVEGSTVAVRAGDRWGAIALNPSPVYFEDQRLNIVQHPSGRLKELAIQNNQVRRLFVNVVRYTTDTEPGSSGSPVFDNFWQLVALHHAGGERDASGKWLDNEGIRIDSIIEDLRDHFSSDDAVWAELSL